MKLEWIKQLPSPNFARQYLKYMENSLKLVQQLIEASYEKDRQDKIDDPSKIGESFFTHYLKLLKQCIEEEHVKIKKD